MKIFTNKAVYVQKNDIIFLNHSDLPIPASIFLKVFGREITIIDDSNRFEFVKFEEENEIEFFKQLDWILDYDSVKSLSESQIMELGQNIAIERNNIAIRYNAMDVEERSENQEMVYECDRLDFKMSSLRDFLWFKQGHLKFYLPDEVDYPEGFERTEEKGLRRILSKFKKKRY